MTNTIFDNIWSNMKQNASCKTTFIKEGEKEMMIDKENLCFAISCRAGDIK